MNELEEFMEIMGSKMLPTYHYYIQSSETQNLLEAVRLEDGTPKKINVKWPIVWKDNDSLGNLGKIEQEVSQGKAKRVRHWKKYSWFSTVRRFDKIRTEADNG